MRNVVNVISSPIRNNKKLKLQNTNPPDTPDTPSAIGPFCIRANCELIDENTDQALANIIGYDTDYNIIEKTLNTCNKFKKIKSNCKEPEVTVIPTHKIQSCDGHIVYKNHVEKTTSILFE